MANVLGSSGRYVSRQAVKRFRRLVLSAVFGIAFIAFLYGAYLVYYLFTLRQSPLICLAVSVLFALLLVFIGRAVSRRMDAYDTERLNYFKGATGEQAVARKIDDFPDGFFVLHDLPTRYGNLDHVVIGPTGVFVLDTKNWKGVITADGRGEIQQNGHRPLKGAVKPLVRRMMNVRDMVKLRLDGNGELPFFSALLVFTAARVDAKWGQTGPARCIRDEQLWDCIVEAKPERTLNASDIARLTELFSALASIDESFRVEENRRVST